MLLQNSDVDSKLSLQKKERGKGECRRGKVELEENEVYSEIVERGKCVREMFLIMLRGETSQSLLKASVDTKAPCFCFRRSFHLYLGLISVISLTVFCRNGSAAVIVF